MFIHLKRLLVTSKVRETETTQAVMVIETTSVDQGADISEFSQYPGEKEFL